MDLRATALVAFAVIGTVAVSGAAVGTAAAAPSVDCGDGHDGASVS